MDLRDIVRGPKTSILNGSWQSGNIARSAWPSRRAKSKAYKWGPSYRWRIIEFECLGLQCRVRILLNKNKQIFKAALGVTENGETKTLCEYEFHATEPGWHCHARCEDIDSVDPGRNRYGGVRLPAADSFHRRMYFRFATSELNELSAFNCAVRFYRIDRSGELL